MARSADPAIPSGSSRPAGTAPRQLWRTPLVVGICFGLGYGITYRLLALQLPDFVRLGQSFDVRPFPGTSLDSLLQRFGAEGQAIRGDLDLIELEAENRKEEEQVRLQAEKEKQRLAVPEVPLATEEPLPSEPDVQAAPAAPTLPPPPPAPNL